MTSPDPDTDEPDAAATWVELRGALAPGLHALWHAGALCDVELVAGDFVTLRAHRVVLAASSAFFSALFAGSGALMAERGASSVALPALDGGTLRALLGAVYRGGVSLAPDNVERLLAASTYLQVGA
jgi:hypothetical protein